MGGSEGPEPSPSPPSSTSYSLADDPAKTCPTGFFAVYRIITPFRPVYTTSSFGDLYIRPAQIRRPELPRRAAIVPAEPATTTFDFSSLQERAKDILVVIVGLLFGVSCGALTAAFFHLMAAAITRPSPHFFPPPFLHFLSRAAAITRPSPHFSPPPLRFLSRAVAITRPSPHSPPLPKKKPKKRKKHPDNPQAPSIGPN